MPVANAVGRPAALRCQTCSSTPIAVTPSRRAGSSITGAPRSTTWRLIVCQPTPSPRARPATVADLRGMGAARHGRRPPGPRRACGAVATAKDRRPRVADLPIVRSLCCRPASGPTASRSRGAGRPRSRPGPGLLRISTLQCADGPRRGLDAVNLRCQPDDLERCRGRAGRPASNLDNSILSERCRERFV